MLFTTNPETTPPLCMRTVLDALALAERNSCLDNFSDAVFAIASRPLTGVQITASGCHRLLEAFQSAEASVSRTVPRFRAEFAVGRDAVATILWFWSKGGQRSAEDFELAFLASLQAESFFLLLERLCTERMIASVKADVSAKKVAA